MSTSDGRMLPVAEARRAIVRMIRKHHATIIVGETGSGKTTQIPQFVWDDYVSTLPEGERGLVGCTQPRRVAAVSVARHVAQQRGGRVGGEVGYAVRFDDTTTPKTKIKYMTDGILLREIQTDPDLLHYKCIILDEAHERTLHGDVLFGLLKDITRRRKATLRIVIMSATLNAEQFSVFWRNAPIGVVHGRSFPVTVMHSVEPQADYVEATISTVLQIHENEPPGDVLCFLTGQEEIEDTKRILEQRMKLLPNTVADFFVQTLYAAMPYEQQLAVFEPAPAGRRKIILATNIAETSITVEGIKYVIDSGVVKAKFFNHKTGMEALTEVDVSKAQATQRTGRAGRMSAGKCYRLYTAHAFEALQENTVPEIRRSSLNAVVLQMKSIGVDNIMGFEFMDMPRPEAIVKATETLILLGALDKDGHITALGHRLTDFPIEPMAAKVLLVGKALHCLSDAITAVALVSTENLFLSSGRGEGGVNGDKCRAVFAKVAGDHATLLSIYSAYRRAPSAQRHSWCETNGVSFRQMQKAEDIMTQLRALLLEKDDADLLTELLPPTLKSVLAAAPEAPHDESQNGQESTSGRDSDSAARESTHVAQGKKRKRDAGQVHDGRFDDNAGFRAKRGEKNGTVDFEMVRRALCAGYFLNTAYFNAKLGFYQTVIGQQAVHLHPSSVLFPLRRKPPLVLFNSVVQTTKRYMKDVSSIHEEWLTEAASTFFKPL